MLLLLKKQENILTLALSFLCGIGLFTLIISLAYSPTPSFDESQCFTQWDKWYTNRWTALCKSEKDPANCVIANTKAGDVLWQSYIEEKDTCYKLLDKTK